MIEFNISIDELPKAEAKIHSVACKNCPSVMGTDPEVEEILRQDHAYRVTTAFVCGWRPTRYCKGYCDQMGITKEDILTLNR